MTYCKARGDAICSRDCENPDANAAMSVTKNGTKFTVRGCPVKQIPANVRFFYQDRDKLERGILAAYSHEEIPAKFVTMCELYDNWFPFLLDMATKRDRRPDTTSIDQFRAGSQ